MKQEENSYRQIIKATSLFGAVQLFDVIVAIIRSKLLAVLLGPLGMGISALLNSSLGLIQNLTNFGLGTSAIKDIALANEKGDENRIGVVTAVLKRLVWITGLLGTIVTFFLAPWLSEITFKTVDYTTAFMLLSVTLLFNQLARGHSVILQGTRKLKLLAKANLIGALIGLFVSMPLYYFFGIDGIVPAIFLSSVTAFFIALFFSKKVKIPDVDVSMLKVIAEGNGMLRMGFMLSLSGLITAGTSHIVRLVISSSGNLSDVGLYGAGLTIINTYVGMVFAAMVTDYYPRLSGVAQNNLKVKKLINQQAVIAVLILAPILAFFISYISWIIVFLYSSKFIAVNSMIQYAALGIYFKAASWSVGFVFLAKGSSKLFFWSELITNTYLLALNILGYQFLGLTGLGVSFLISYILLFFQVLLIARNKYGFQFDSNFLKIFGLQLSLGILCFNINLFVSTQWSYALNLPIVIVSGYYSFLELDKRIDLRAIISDLKTKANKP